MWQALAGQLFGSLLNQELQDEGPSYQSQVDNANAQQDKNIALQREFAQMGVRWRVEDAKAAGLHPMYALTGGGAAFSPNPIVMPGVVQGQTSSGASGFGNAFEKLLTGFFSAQAAKDDVIAKAVAATAAVAQSNSISSVPAPTDYQWDMDYSGGPHHGAVNLQNAFDVQQFNPAPVLSRDMASPSLTPGTGPGGSVHNIAPGFNMILPSGQGGTAEALESLSESWQLMNAYVHRNVEEYGEEWLDKAEKYFPASSAMYKVIRNLQNASTWARPVLDTLGHRSREWLNDMDARYEHLREVRGMRSRAAHREGLPRTFWGTMPRR